MTDDAAAGKPIIVVGVDGSESSKSALRYALTLAVRNGWELRALRAWTYSQSLAYTSADWNPDGESSAKLSHDIVETCGQMPPQVTMAVRQGYPAEALVAEAVECRAEFIVVGSRNLGQRSTEYGDVNSQLVRIAPCPVLTVPGGASAEHVPDLSTIS